MNHASGTDPGGAGVLLLGGSPGDLDLILEARETLAELEIPCSIRILSAHRTPELASACARDAEKNGFQVIIAFAGLAAHLAGLSAAHSRLPVIGVPRAVGPLRGIDAALASMQMPAGTPVATVGIDGAANAALLAARILGIADPGIRERLEEQARRRLARYAPERIEAEIEKRTRARRDGPRG